MGVELLTERYKGQIAGVLSCYDRIIIQGTVPGWCYASGMTDYFYAHRIRIFDYPKSLASQLAVQRHFPC